MTNIDQTSQNSKTDTFLDRRFSKSNKLPPIVNHAIEAGYGSEIVTVAPPGATIAPYSKINAAFVGKIPMLFDPRKVWWRGFPWTKHRHTQEELECCAVNGGGFGLRAGKLVSLDCDVGNEEQVKAILKILHRLGWRGAIRCRRGSPRVLLVFSCKPDFVPTYRYISWCDRNGARHTVERLGDGKFYVVHGIHPKSRTEYCWIKDVDPFVFGVPNLTQSDKGMFDEVFATLIDTIRTQNWGDFVLRGGRTGNSGPRKSIDDPSLRAPSPEHVLDILKAWPNTPENVPTHGDFVAAIAAVKSALGPDRESFYGDVEQWALEYPGNDADYVRARWDSIT